MEQKRQDGPKIRRLKRRTKTGVREMGYDSIWIWSGTWRSLAGSLVSGSEESSRKSKVKEGKANYK